MATASLAVGASAVGSYAQAPGQGGAMSTPDRADPRRAAQTRRPVRAPAAEAAATKQKPTNAKTKPQAAAAADNRTRTEFSLADEAVAKVPGLPADVRFWGDSVADFQRALPAEP